MISYLRLPAHSLFTALVAGFAKGYATEWFKDIPEFCSRHSSQQNILEHSSTYVWFQTKPLLNTE